MSKGRAPNMPTGPQGQKRPADVIVCAVTVAKISTGEIAEDEYTAPGRRREISV